MGAGTDVAGAIWSMALLTGVFTLKHYVADFLLQTTWMALGKDKAQGWFAPLAAHVACHAVLTLAIALAWAPRLWWLALVDLCVHAAIDRGKSLVSLRGQWTPEVPQFWWLLGLDQCLHQITNIGLALALLLL